LGEEKEGSTLETASSSSSAGRARCDGSPSAPSGRLLVSKLILMDSFPAGRLGSTLQSHGSEPPSHAGSFNSQNVHPTARASGPSQGKVDTTFIIEMGGERGAEGVDSLTPSLGGVSPRSRSGLELGLLFGAFPPQTHEQSPETSRIGLSIEDGISDHSTLNPDASEFLPDRSELLRDHPALEPDPDKENEARVDEVDKDPQQAPVKSLPVWDEESE
jgi:hypothetical protein